VEPNPACPLRLAHRIVGAQVFQLEQDIFPHRRQVAVLRRDATGFHFGLGRTGVVKPAGDVRLTASRRVYFNFLGKFCSSSFGEALRNRLPACAVYFTQSS
jgi:hypothetical protein